MNGNTQSRWLVYFLAVFLPILVLALRVTIVPDTIHPGLILFILPTAICAFMGGLRPGLTCTALSALLAAYFLMPPIFSLAIASNLDKAQWLAFVAAGGVISYLAERLHQSQDRLREDESRLSAMFNAAMDGIVTVDEQLIIVYLNPAAEKMFGRKAAELIGTPARLLVPASHRRLCERMVRNLAVSGALHRFVQGPVKGLRANGDEFPVDATISKVDVQGKQHFTLVVRDVSERKAAEDALRESEALYRTLIESLNEGVLLWDSNGRIEAFNPAAERILGWPSAEFVGKHYSELPWRPRASNDADFDPEKLAVAIIQRTGHPILHRERTLTRRNGKEIWILQNGIPLTGNAKNARPRVMITFTDVTERRKASETLSQMADIVANSEDAIISKSLDGVIQTWNPGAERMLGHPASAAIDRRLNELILPLDQHAAEQEIRARIARGESAQSFETVFARKDGKQLNISATASPLRDAGNTIVGVSVIARDITDRKQAEQALLERDAAEEASRLKSEFLATMSHELRTPLTGVIGFAEYLRASQAGPINEEQAECIDSIYKSSLHLLDLINGILDLSKIEAGKMELVPETFAVRDMVDEVCGVISPIALKKRIAVQRRVAQALTTVTLDRPKFRQVLYNLLSNAVKFTDDGGHVDIDVDVARMDTPHLRIRVADTGIGIAPEDIDKLFKNFHQLDNSNTRRHEGAGLGLALTKKIVELQRGIITVESAPGRGSVFTVTLPY